MKKLSRKVMALTLALVMALGAASVGFEFFGVKASAAGEAEKNNTVVTATPISVNETVYGSTSDIDDEDYYKFVLDNAGYIQIEFCHDYNSLSHYLRMKTYDGTKESALYYNVLPNNAEIIKSVKIGLPAGTYYFLVSGGYDVNDYNFTINYSATDNWEKERNNNVVSATPISINSRAYGATIGDEDKDYYKFTLEQSGYVQIDFEHQFGSIDHYINIRTYDGTNEKKTYFYTVNRESETAKSEKVSLSAGTYYIRVDTGWTTETEYSFELQFFDSIEPPTKIEYTTARREQTTASKLTARYYEPIETTKSSNANKPITGKSQIAKISDTQRGQSFSVTLPDETRQNAPKNSINIYADFQYTVVNNEVIIVCYNGEQANVTIPDKIDGIPVCGVASDAFKSSYAKQVSVPSSVYKFADESFVSENGQMNIVGEKDSPVAQYAQSKNINFDYIYDVSQTEISNESEEIAGSEKSYISTIVLIVLIIVAIATILLILKRKIS